MGALTPVASFALGGLDLMTRMNQVTLARDQQQAQARARAAEIEAQYETDRRRRERALAIAGATARARLGAQAGGTAGGSGEALLAGLADESAADGRDAFAARQRQLRNIATDLAFGRRRNLLDQAQTLNSFLLR